MVSYGNCDLIDAVASGPVTCVHCTGLEVASTHPLLGFKRKCVYMWSLVVGQGRGRGRGSGSGSGVGVGVGSGLELGWGWGW